MSELFPNIPKQNQTRERTIFESKNLNKNKAQHVLWNNIFKNITLLINVVYELYNVKLRCVCVCYLCAVLRLGHSGQELEDGLRLRDQRRDGVDDGCEL